MTTVITVGKMHSTLSIRPRKHKVNVGGQQTVSDSNSQMMVACQCRLSFLTDMKTECLSMVEHILFLYLH